MEIAAIFTEESAELLESTDRAFGEWVRDKSRATGRRGIQTPPAHAEGRREHGRNHVHG